MSTYFAFSVFANLLKNEWAVCISMQLHFYKIYCVVYSIE